jgi:hypothetical protein
MKRNTRRTNSQRNHPQPGSYLIEAVLMWSNCGRDAVVEIAEFATDETELVLSDSFVVVNTSPEVEVLELEEMVVFIEEVMLTGKEDTVEVDASEDDIVEDMLSILVRSVEFIVIFLRLTTLRLLLH